jgi:hypothetical protein
LPTHRPPPPPLVASSGRAAAFPAATPSAAEQTVQTRRRPARTRWFVLGLAAGMVAMVVARGDGPATLREIREWSANALRSLEHKSARGPKSELPSPPDDATVVTAPVTKRPAHPADAPCPVDPGAADPCAELLAPFTKMAASIPSVSIDDLPRVQPPPPTATVARAKHVTRGGRGAPAAVAQETHEVDDAPAESAPPSNAEIVAARQVPIYGSDPTAENDVR